MSSHLWESQNPVEQTAEEKKVGMPRAILGSDLREELMECSLASRYLPLFKLRVSLAHLTQSLDLMVLRDMVAHLVVCQKFLNIQCGWQSQGPRKTVWLLEGVQD